MKKKKFLGQSNLNNPQMKMTLLLQKKGKAKLSILSFMEQKRTLILTILSPLLLKQTKSSLW